MDGKRKKDFERLPSIYQTFRRREANFTEYVEYVYRARTKAYGYFKPIFAIGQDQKAANAGKSIFNMEFCPIDDTVYTVDSDKMIQIFDPRIHSPSRKPSHVVRRAHDDCINCITFLEGHLFATCSDDTTIKIWDSRNLFQHVAHMRGHTSWVKNIEYDNKSNLLFSIAFYDGVRKWDMNQLEFYNETPEVTDNIVFPFDDPVRMRICPDKSKMFVSLRENLCLVVDKFDGSTIHEAAPLVHELTKHRRTKQLYDLLKPRRRNRLAIHTMTALRNKGSYRAVMSADFHPSGELIGLRHVDIRTDTPARVELTTLYDLGYEYAPFFSSEKTMHNYMRYIDETSTEDGVDYIKEIAFSRDGRILASPYKGGVRLLSIDRRCSPYDYYMDKRFDTDEKYLHSLDFDVVSTSLGHSSPVLTCKFANHDALLGTGCMGGHVVFHKPQI